MKKIIPSKLLLAVLLFSLYACKDKSPGEGSAPPDVDQSATPDASGTAAVDSAAAVPPDASESNYSSADYISGSELPLDALATEITKKFKSSGSTKAVRLSKIPSSRDELTGGIKVVRIEHKGNTEAGITLPAFGATLNKNESSLDVYYLEYALVNDSAVYGIGYSVHYLFRKIKRGISLSNLANIAASAQLNNGKTDVSYSLQTYGISGPVVANFFKPVINQDYDVNGYGIIQASVDGLHGLLADTATSKYIHFKPVLFKNLKAGNL